MRLVIPVFFKAGKLGLVPVKKQVSKKGKPFMQTFWVKPGDAPVSKKKRSSTPVSNKTKSVKDMHNTPEGFVAAWHSGDGYKVGIPDSSLLETFSFAGADFVVTHFIHGSISQHVDAKYAGSGLMMDTSRFSVYEKTTGLTVTGDSDTYLSIDAAKKFAKARIRKYAVDHHGIENIDKDFAELKSKSSLIKDNENISVMVRSSGIPSKDRSKPDALKMIEEHLSYISTSYEKDLKSNAPTAEEVYKWLGEGLSEGVIRSLLSDVDDKFILREAIQNKLTYDEAADREDRIRDAMSDILGYARYASDKDSLRAKVVKWGIENHANFENNGSMPHEAMGTNISLGEYWSHAIAKDISLKFAVEHLNEFNEDRILVGNFVDVQGSTWDYKELKPLGIWVKGGDPLKEYRKEAKAIFEERTAGRPDGVTDTFAQCIESHAHMVKGNGNKVVSNLYRGTQNPVWVTAKVGDVIPIGMASFSKTKFTAHNFATTAILELDCTNPDNPVYGVDINGLSDTLRDGSPEDLAVLNVTDIDGCKNEDEVIVVAPVFEIVDIDRSGKIPNIAVRQRRMDLVHLIKSKFDSRDNARLAELEKEFDLSLHRLPKRR